MLEDSPWTLHFCDAVLGDSRTNRGQAEISLHSRTWSPDFVQCHPNPSRGRRLESIHHREAAISASAGHARSLLNFRKAEGQAYEGIEPPRPNIAEDNPAAWHRCMPQTDVLPTVHVPATTAVHGPCPPKPPPPSYRDGTAICLALAQRGKYRTMAGWANSLFGPESARANEPSFGTKIEPPPSHDPNRISALRYAISEYPRAASVAMTGG